MNIISEKNYFSITATIFSIITILHILRLLLGWNAIIGSWTVPFWLSWVAFIVAGFLAYSGFKLGRGKS